MAKGQVSTEVLIVIGVMLFLLVPLLLYAHSKVNLADSDLAVQKAEFAAQRLVSLADSVGYIGGEAAAIDEIEVPPGVQSVTLSGHELVFTLNSPSGSNQIVKSSAFELVEPSPPAKGISAIKGAGTYFVEVQAIAVDESGVTKGKVQLSLK